MCWTVILGINNAFQDSYCMEVQVVDDVETLMYSIGNTPTNSPAQPVT